MYLKTLFKHSSSNIRIIIYNNRFKSTTSLIKIMSKQTLSKAPNILVLTEYDDEFNIIRNFLRNLLGVNSYTIYNIKLTQLNQIQKIWMDNCKLLVTTEQSVVDEKLKQLKLDYVKNYLNIGGKILSIPSLKENLHVSVKDFNEFKFAVYDGNYSFEDAYKENVERGSTFYFENFQLQDYIYFYKLNENIGSQCVSKVYPVANVDSLTESQKDELSKSENILQKIYLSLLTDNLKLMSNEAERSFSNVQPYTVFSKNKLLQSVNVIENYLRVFLSKNVELCTSESNSHFNHNEYFKSLNTKKLGQIVLFSHVVTSTMNALTEVPNSMDNIIAIANHQIEGQGNGKNEWISPAGCAMFTLYLNLNANSFSSSRLCLLQYATAMSCVEAVIQTPGYEHVPLRIKWPNDVFYDNNSKIGGILVKSSIMAEYFNVKIGVGVNVSNAHPTVCLNKILEEVNLDKWTTETFMAKCLNRLEYHLEYLRTSTNLDSFLALYQKYWIHQNQVVHVDYWNEDVQVIGIDSYGFLKVKRQNDEINLLQPDGNRFDMMRNLIVFK